MIMDITFHFCLVIDMAFKDLQAFSHFAKLRKKLCVKQWKTKSSHCSNIVPWIQYR